MDRIAVLGAELLSETVTAIQNGTAVRTPQDPALVTYAPMLSKALSPLDFSRSAAQLHNQVRGLNPWPSAQCRLHGKVLKVHASAVGVQTDQPVGTVTALDPLSVACGDGITLRLLEVQYEGSKRMQASDFLRGHAVAVGEIIE